MLQAKSEEYLSTYQLYQHQYQRFIGFQPDSILVTSQTPPLRYDRSNKQTKTSMLASIDELTLNAFNTGKYLKLKVIHPPFKVNAISLLVEDHTERNCIFVSLYNYNTNGRHYAECFRVGTVFYLEDPYYKVSQAGWNIIRVENHFDVILEDSQQAKRLTKMYQQPIQQPLKSKQVSLTERLRLKGVDLMKNGEYVKAYGVYTQAIKLSVSPEDLIKFKLNKAISCLKLNLTKQYCQFSEEVLKIDPKHLKGLYHQAKARAILGDMSYGDKLIQSSQIDEASKKDLIKFLQIEKSFRSGKINWYEAIRSSETSSFTNNGVKIRKGSFGMGNFATRLIKAGELIYVQKPFLCQTFGLFTNKSDKDIIVSLATELYSYSDQFKQKFNQLSFKGQKQRNRSQNRKIDRNLFSEIIFNNCFSTNDIKDQLEYNQDTRSRVLYSNISMLNHRCEMNCDYLNIGDSMVIYCIQDIQPGEELFISYKVIMPYYSRLHVLDTWGISCNCILCRQQESDKEQEFESRQLRKFECMNNYETEGLLEFRDYDAFKYMLFDMRKKKEAAIMLRRILPMSKKESQELVGLE